MSVVLVRCDGPLYCFSCMFPLREKRSPLPRRGGLIRHLRRPLLYACSQIDRGSAYCFCACTLSLIICLLSKLTSSFTREVLFFLRLASGEKSILIMSTVIGHSAHCRLPGLDDLHSEARLLVAPLEGEWKHVVRDGVEDLEELGGDSFAEVNSHFPLVQGVADI